MPKKKPSERIANFLNKIFAPRVTYYYNSKISAGDRPEFKRMMKKMERMEKAMNEIFREET